MTLQLAAELESGGENSAVQNIDVDMFVRFNRKAIDDRQIDTSIDISKGQRLLAASPQKALPELLPRSSLITMLRTAGLTKRLTERSRRRWITAAMACHSQLSRRNIGRIREIDALIDRFRSIFSRVVSHEQTAAFLPTPTLALANAD